MKLLTGRQCNLLYRHPDSIIETVARIGDVSVRTVTQRKKMVAIILSHLTKTIAVMIDTKGGTHEQTDVNTV